MLYQKVVRKLLKYKRKLIEKDALYIKVDDLPITFQPLNVSNINKLLRYMDKKILKFAYNKTNRHLLEVVELPAWINVKKLVDKTKLTLSYLNSRVLKATILKIVSLVVKVEKLSKNAIIDLSNSKILKLKFSGNSLQLYQFLNNLLSNVRKIDFDPLLVEDWVKVCEKIDSL
jgi:hypothetical protein